MPTRILIIEDNRANMELMVYLLGAYGYEAQSACQGKEGIEKALRHPPDLIICDLEMPEMNGFEVIARVRGTASLQKIPVIAVTAYAMVGDRDKVLAAGFNSYLPKPISPDTFVKQIESLLISHKRSSRSPSLPEQAPRPVTREKSSRARILVVDDSPVNLSLFQSTLEPSGYTVVAVPSALDAMAALSQDSFELILADLHMPEESGLGLLGRVKRDPKLQSVPFVIFTASSGGQLDMQREHAMKLGAKRFLNRPIEPGYLLGLIEELLSEEVRSAEGKSAGR